MKATNYLTQCIILFIIKHMNNKSHVQKLKELLREKEKISGSLNNLENLYKKEEVTARQYDELKKDYSDKLADINAAIANIKEEIKEELAGVRSEKESLEEAYRKLEMQMLIGEIPSKKGKIEREKYGRKIDNVEKHIRIYEVALKSESFREFETKINAQTKRTRTKSSKQMRNLRELLSEKVKQDDNLKNLEGLFRNGQVNSKEYNSLKKEYLFKLEEIIDQIEKIRREIDLYVGELKVEKEKWEDEIEEIEVRKKVGEIDSDKQQAKIDKLIKQIGDIEQQITRLIKIQKASSPEDLADLTGPIYENEEEEVESKELLPSKGKQKSRAGFVAFGVIILVLTGGYFVGRKYISIPIKKQHAKSHNVQEFVYKEYMGNPSHSLFEGNFAPSSEPSVKSRIKLSGRVMFPALIDKSLFLITETGDYYILNMLTDSLSFKGNISSMIDMDPIAIKSNLIVGDLTGNIYVYKSTKDSLLRLLKLSGAINSTPSYYQHTLYLFTGEGGLYAYDLIADSIKWKLKIKNGGSATPLIHNDNLYVLDRDGTLYNFNRASGVLQWKFKTNEPSMSSPIYFNKKVFFTTLAGHIFVVNADTPVLKWKAKLDAPSKSSPACSKNGAVVVTDMSGNVYAFATLDSTLMWKYHMEHGIMTSAVITDSLVIVNSQNEIACLDLFAASEKGKLLWSKIIGEIMDKPPFVYKGSIYAVTVQGHLLDLGSSKVAYSY